MTTIIMKLWQWLILLFCIVGFVGISIGSALGESLTFDEIVHRQEGLNHWLNHTFNIDTFNPPLVREIEVIPILLGSDKLMTSGSQSLKYLPDRLVTVFLAVFLLILVFIAAKKYFDINCALLAVFLLAFNPIFLAHSHYLTLDSGTALFIFLAYLLYLKLIRETNLWNFVYFGMALGFALAARIVTVPFFISALPLILIVEKKNAALTWFWRNKFIIFYTLMITALVIWSAYFFRTDVIIASRSDNNRLSARLLTTARNEHNNTLADLIKLAENRKLPLGNYLAMVKNNLVRSGKAENYFFLGHFYAHNRWYFLPVNLFLKTPLPFWLLLVMGVRVLYGKKEFGKNLLPFLLPAAVLIAILSFGNNQPWVRYTVPVFPFLSVIAATGLKEFRGIYRSLALAILLIWYALTPLNSYPHFIGFANELAGPKDKLYRIFADSNLDWGQSIPDLVKYVNKVNPKQISFSYFGRDNGDTYGLSSNFPYGSHIFENICRFHEIPRPSGSGGRMIAISVTNWYDCGFSKLNEFSQTKITDVVGDSIFIFY